MGLLTVAEVLKSAVNTVFYLNVYVYLVAWKPYISKAPVYSSQTTCIAEG